MGVFKTAFSAVFRAFRGILLRDGVHVGETAGYPRVELHSWEEAEPLDKDNALREITLVVESISDQSLSESVAMADENIARLLNENDIVVGDFDIVGVVSVSVTQSTEVSDTNNTLYHIAQTLRVYVQQQTN